MLRERLAQAPRLIVLAPAREAFVATASTLELKDVSLRVLSAECYGVTCGSGTGAAFLCVLG